MSDIERREMNLKNVYMLERIGPNYMDFHFKLKFWAETPGGKLVNCTIDFPAYFVEELGAKLHEVVKEQQRHLDNSKKSLQTGSIL